MEGILFRWAEYHPWWFRQRLVQHRLGTFDLNIFNGKALQEGSNIQEYQEFLRYLETTREQPQVSEKTLVPTPTFSWMIYLGIGSAIILVCWLGCQCWYSGIRVLKTRGPTTTPGLFCKVLCCGMAALLEKPEYQPMTGVGGDQGDLQDSDLDSVRMKAYWSRGSSDMDQTTGLTVGGTASQVAIVPDN